ncbi:MAG: outer membrane protein assembly factor BamA [Saprospiraceae bacterium]|nr:outer membrane protein assembly factor BamA [Saprospiraceae bacterium]MCF8252023.1 outer membrane protein assembly factor BamA [Saprospiraceae bacterium]MCF8281712.1 outer membrane protein assembly factor BamA [Bacteroidales bacterium]MCF8313700.1 outer membrane protein assembly factor BamA [Saprospiraceae bacterium]MCF8442407.1 outer membrane protein assembly factor BamA [Saprospiraceae bacterium]
MLKYSWLIFLALLFTSSLAAQETDTLQVMEYSSPKDYEIGGIKVTGAHFSDESALISVAGLRVGDRVRIPGSSISKAVKGLLKLGLFEGVEIFREKTIGDVVFLEIAVQERPRLTSHSFKGVKKSQHDDLNLKIEPVLVKGGIVTEHIKASASLLIRQYFVEKGYADASVTVQEVPEKDQPNAVHLVFDVETGGKVKVQDITFEGNAHVKDRKLQKLLETKPKRKLFASSKLIPEELENGKAAMLKHYQSLGFLDARIVCDSVWRENPKGEWRIHFNLEEGQRYHFGNITWRGNSKYDNTQLSKVLGIQKGDVYNPELLQNRLSFSQNGDDVSSLYMDKGYLFFQVDPATVAVRGDTVDLELRMYEGPQARVDKVVIKGNDQTNEHVIRRELFTEPGKTFSRADIIRSQRQIANLGYFNPENLGINTPVNPQRGTVDVEYTVEEKNSDQLELSAGWGGTGIGLTGTLGVTFNNFSLRNALDRSTWRPLPTGDGQKLSLRVQTNGKAYQSYNMSFTEPWLGGKKPNSLTVANFYSRYTNGYSSSNDYFESFSVLGSTVSLGKRLQFPDDNFVASTALSFQKYSLDNWTSGLFQTDDGQLVSNGNFYNLSLKQTIARTTINNPIYPMEGSRVSLSVQLTPPYSLFGNRNSGTDAVQLNKWVEYHKWRFDSEWYTTLTGKLVLKASAKFGFLGAYNSSNGISPFERFQLGGDGLSNTNGSFTGTDIISLRGYEVSDLENNLIDGTTVATPIYNKFTLELRYPLSLNPSSTIYGLAFLEGGNSWQSFKAFNPFDVKRSAGVGLRVFLPMFGTLGFDYGVGFDKTGVDKSLKGMGKFSIILGFEPD